MRFIVEVSYESDEQKVIGDFLESKGLQRDKYIIIKEKDYEYLPEWVLEFTNGSKDPDAYVMDDTTVADYIEYFTKYTIETIK